MYQAKKTLKSMKHVLFYQTSPLSENLNMEVPRLGTKSAN